MKPPNACRRGFTLTELLIAISIIALLVGLLLPALSSARETGRSAVCLSNLRQMGIAYAVYAQDFDGHLSIASISNTGVLEQMSPWGGVSPEERVWQFYIGQIVDPTLNTRLAAATNICETSEILSDSVFACPSADFDPNPVGNGFLVSEFNYGMNRHVGAESSRYDANAFFRSLSTSLVSAIQEPSAVMLNVDSSGGAELRSQVLDPTNAAFRPGVYRHYGSLSGNFSFIDGHATAVGIENILSPLSSTAPERISNAPAVKLRAK